MPKIIKYLNRKDYARASILQELLHSFNEFCAGGVEVVIDDYAIELGGETKLENSFADALVEAADSFGTAFVKPVTQHFNGRCLYKNRQRSIGVGILHGNGTFYIYIHKRGFACVPYACKFGFHSTVILTGVYHFPFYKSFLLYHSLKGVLTIEIIVAAMLFSVAGLPRACGYRKRKLGTGLQQLFHQGGFARARRSGNDYDLSCRQVSANWLRITEIYLAFTNKKGA